MKKESQSEGGWGLGDPGDKGLGSGSGSSTRPPTAALDKVIEIEFPTQGETRPGGGLRPIDEAPGVKARDLGGAREVEQTFDRREREGQPQQRVPNWILETLGE